MRRAILFPVVLIGLVLAALLFYASTYVVTERQQAIKLRFGEIQAVITEPGLYFKWPTNIVDSVQYIDRRLLTIELSDITVQVRGDTSVGGGGEGRRYVVNAFLTYRITDAQRFREAVQGRIEAAEERMLTRFEDALRTVYGLVTYEAALSEARVAMMREVLTLLRPEAATLGLEIVDVRITRTELAASVNQQTYERMRQERLAAAAEIRRVGTVLAETIRGEAARQAAIITAEAERYSQIQRGIGDAGRTEILGTAFGADPAFFDFFRSMEAMATGLPGQALVLSPESSFLRYFSDPDSAFAAIAATAVQREIPVLPDVAPLAPPEESVLDSVTVPDFVPESVLQTPDLSPADFATPDAIGTAEPAGTEGTVPETTGEATEAPPAAVDTLEAPAETPSETATTP